jgi:hypothetical protein
LGFGRVEIAAVETGDELLGLLTGEPARRLTLGETERVTRLTETFVAR